METIAAGYEFAHRDDYEGRHVLPTIKIDADSRNIEELHVQADRDKYRPDDTGVRPAAREDWLPVQGIRRHDGRDGEQEPDHRRHQPLGIGEADRDGPPDIFCAGIKEKYVVQKMGVPCKQLHSYDYGGPFAGFAGAINFYAEIDRMVNAKVWSFLKAPWEIEGRRRTPLPKNPTSKRSNQD